MESEFLPIISQPPVLCGAQSGAQRHVSHRPLVLNFVEEFPGASISRGIIRSVKLLAICAGILQLIFLPGCAEPLNKLNNPAPARGLSAQQGSTLCWKVNKVSAWVNRMPRVIPDKPLPPENRSYGFMTLTQISLENATNTALLVKLQSASIQIGGKKYKPEHIAFQSYTEKIDPKNPVVLTLKAKEKATVEVRAESNHIPAPEKGKAVAVTLALQAGQDHIVANGTAQMEEVW